MLSVDDYMAVFLGVVQLLLFWRIRHASYFFIVSMVFNGLFTVGLYYVAGDASGLNTLFYLLAAVACTIGLWFVRVMLIRSISLNALFLASSANSEDRETPVKKILEEQMVYEMSKRIDDLNDQHLIIQNQGQLSLTIKGRWIACLVAKLYEVIRR